MYTILKFLSRNLFKLFQNSSNRFQGIEVHEVHLFAVRGDESADFGVALRFGDFRDLRIQKFHHNSVFQAESGVIDGAAKVGNFTFVVMRCGNLLFEALSHHIISRIRQDFQRFLEIFGFHKDIIRIESGYRKNSNAIFCKNSREFRKDTYKRKILTRIDITNVRYFTDC